MSFFNSLLTKHHYRLSSTKCFNFQKNDDYCPRNLSTRWDLDSLASEWWWILCSISPWKVFFFLILLDIVWKRSANCVFKKLKNFFLLKFNMFWCAGVKNNFLKIKKFIGMHFSIKNYLKNNHNHTAQHFFKPVNFIIRNLNFCTS